MTVSWLGIPLTLYHAGNLFTDAGGESGRVSAKAAGGINGCLHFYLVIGLQTLMDAVRRKAAGSQ